MLTKKQVRRFYDHFGAKQDWQRIYEGQAIRTLLQCSEFESAQVVFEFGCGTGAFAAQLLTRYLPATSLYLGCDLSSTMVSLTQDRLRPFAPRATVELIDGFVELNVAPLTVDRFVSNYVLDLLPADEITTLLTEAHRILRPGGKLCLISLSYGTTPFSRWLVSLWQQVHACRADLVGGCRPLALLDFVSDEGWRIHHYSRVTVLGLPSDIVVAEKVPHLSSEPDLVR